MMLSLNVMGYGPMGQAFVKKFKSLGYYKENDFDRTKVRIHTVVVRDNGSSKYQTLKAVYERQPEGVFCCLGDGTEKTGRETPLCDDIPWLMQTSGHDVVVDMTSYNQESKDLLLQQIGRGYWGILCNKEVVKNHWQEILDAAKSAENGPARLSFNALAVGIDDYKDIDLNQRTFEQYANDSRLYEINASVEEVADAIISELDKEYWIRLKKDEGWRNLSEEEKSEYLEKQHEAHEAERLSRPPVPPKPTSNAPTLDACGINDTVDWAKFKAKLFENDKKAD